MLTLHIPPDLLHQIEQYAEQAYPYECSGLLLGDVAEGGDRSVRHIAPVPNPEAAEGVTDRYRIESSDFLRVDRLARSRNLEILGCYHSHPDGEAMPSAVDLAAAWPWYAYLILAVHDGHTVDHGGWVLTESPGQAPQLQAIQLCAMCPC